MPFMKGAGAIRRTMAYLMEGNIILRDNVKAIAFGYNPGKHYQHHHGLYEFVFWHLTQMKFKNPRTHYVTFKKLTPTPWIKAYLTDEESIVIDCDSRSREEIYKHVKLVLSKSEDDIFQAEEKIKAQTANPANFGGRYSRQCICEVPGQLPCPGWKPLPQELRGKYRMKLLQEQKQT